MSSLGSNVFQFRGNVIRFVEATKSIDIKYADGVVDSYKVDEMVAEDADETARVESAFVRIVGQVICMAMGLEPTALESLITASLIVEFEPESGPNTNTDGDLN